MNAPDLFEKVTEAAGERIRSDGSLRRNLPASGRLHLDRTLPFLVVYRVPPGRLDEGTARLVTALSSYLLVSGDERFVPCVRRLVGEVAREIASELGACLVVELWTTADDGGEDPEDRLPEPALEVVAGPASPPCVEALQEALGTVSLLPRNGGELGLARKTLQVELRREESVAPPGCAPLIGPDADTGVFTVGVEITPFFRRPSTGEPYPRVVEVFREELSRALEKGFFTFSQEHTSLDPPHYRALGRRRVGRAARHVDRRLGEVTDAYDLLLQVTPVNSNAAWEAFRGDGFQHIPELRYRPLPFDPERLKGRLFDVPIDHVEDPLLGTLFREKQEEVDREISLMRDLDTPGFLPGSLQLHGGVKDDLVEVATEALRRIPPPEPGRGEEEYGDDPEAANAYVGAEEFADHARDEVDHYRRLSQEFTADVQIRPDVAAGLMVVKGTLCVSSELRTPRERVRPLLQHEVGTHLVTWCNGRSQPFRIFASGLAGYEALQEGLAVLSEYLVGGLTPGRARVLAGRVIAVRCLVDGASFVDTFRRLREAHGFAPRTAFFVTLRVYRGGGFTKDAHYLRGLRDLLAYLEGEGALDPLLVGKLGLSHADVVQELVLRGILRLPVVKPRYTSDLAAMERLGACRNMSVLDVLEGSGRFAGDTAGDGRS